MNSADPAGCKYCKHCGNTSTIMINAYIPVEKSSRETMYITNDCRLHYCPKSGRVGAGAKINNCPMCGRELPDVARRSIESLPEQPAEIEKRPVSAATQRLLALNPSLEEESYTIADIDGVLESIRSGYIREVHITKCEKSTIRYDDHGITGRIALIERLEELRKIKILEAEEDHE